MRKPALHQIVLFGSLAMIVVAIGLWIIDVYKPQAELPPIPTVEITTNDPAVQEQFSAARRQLEERPFDPIANGQLGVLYELYQYPEAARTSYERASIISPGDFRWQYYLARMESALGNPAKVIAVLTRVQELTDQYTPALALLGRAYLEQGRASDAEAVFRHAVSIDGESTSALLGLGRSLASTGDHASAINNYELALQLAPQHAPLHYALGLSYRATGDNQRAQQHLETARLGGPANPDADPLVAVIYSQVRGIDADYRKAKALLNARQFEESITILRRIVAHSPEHYGALGALGKALSLTNQNTEAIEVYERAISLNPTNIDFLRPYALLLYRAARYPEAEMKLNTVLKSGGDHADDHHVLGAVLLRLDRRPEAIDQFELVLERNPAHQQARRALVKALRVQASRATSSLEALPYLQRVTELQPDDLQGWSILAGTLVKTGDARAALTALEKALAINPDMPELVKRRDEVLLMIQQG